MSSEINLLVQNCDICRPFLPSQGKQQIIPGTTATGPMTDVGTDLFQIDHNHYLVLVDRYSGFPFAEKLTKLSIISNHQGPHKLVQHIWLARALEVRQWATVQDRI